MVAFRDPFQDLQSELDRMLEVAFGARPFTGVYPALNVFDAGDAYVVRAELPGVDPSKIDVQVVDDALILRGERPLEEPDGNVAYHRREREHGTFRRVVRIPGRLDPGSTPQAEYKNGVLSIRLPKAKETQPRRVEIKAA